MGKKRKKEMIRQLYNVAGHCFAVNVNENDRIVSSLTQYEPFRMDASCDVPTVFELDVVEVSAFPSTEGFVEENSQDDDGSEIVSGHVGDSPFFEFRIRGAAAGRLLTNTAYNHALLTTLGEREYGLNCSLMVMYALSTARLQTALFHSSVTSYQGKGYMFLGKSGTGKSTHSSLWLRYIEGTELMNDDNPVVRIIDGQPWVFGSPWSGKTPCYRNVKAPVGAIVRLRQAPMNEIRRLKGVEAYAALVPAISGKRWDKALADGLHETENLLAQRAHVYHLNCLPDEDAARLCMETVTKED
jgi:hypothetical protein